MDSHCQSHCQRHALHNILHCRKFIPVLLAKELLSVDRGFIGQRCIQPEWLVLDIEGQTEM